MAIIGKYTPPGQPLPSKEEAAAAVAGQEQRQAETSRAPLSFDNFVGRIGKYFEDDENQEAVLSTVGGLVGAYVGGPVGAAAGSQLGKTAASLIPGDKGSGESERDGALEGSGDEGSVYRAYNLSDGRYLVCKPDQAFIASPRSRSVALRSGANVISENPLQLATASGGQADVSEVHRADED